MKLMDIVKSGRILVFDGAMGTQLEARGAEAGGGSNLAAPDVVVAVQRAYADAGSNVVTSNTFCLCDVYARAHKMEFDLDSANRKGVELARAAVDGRALVVGGIGPTGLMLNPFGELSEDEAYETFLKQAKSLAAAGIDGFIIETMSDLKEAVLATRACAEYFDLPVIASMTYSTDRDGGRTVMGDRAADCAAKLAAAGASIVSANCGELTPSQMATIVKSYRSAVDIPILAQPNAGKPRVEGDKTMYDMGPEEFAAGARECISAGATLIGGCCGTTPAHIKAVAEMVAAL